LGEADVSEDFTELYELRRTFSRLDEFVTKNGKAQSPEDRLDIVRAVIAPIAELHGLGIAHRDIGLHNLWHASDNKSVVLSGLSASFFPERGTINELRELLQGSNIRLPEDEMRMDGDIFDPFKQDVFMLAAVAYRVLFPESTLPLDAQKILHWQEPISDAYSGTVSQWLQKALSWDPSARFANAAEQLAALNEITKQSAPSDEDAAITWQAIVEGDFIKRGWSQLQMYTKFPPDQGEDPGASQVLRYRCTVIGRPAQLKLWQQVAPNATTYGLNRRIANFRARVENVAKGGIPTPRILDFGLLESGGLFVVTTMEPGDSWRATCERATIAQRTRLAMALVKAVTVLHEQQLAHGDIHPGNLLARLPVELSSREESPIVVLLDLLDYGEHSQPFNVEYGPPNPAGADAFARDRFAVYKLVEELLDPDADENLRKELQIGLGQPQGIPVSLVPLQNELKRLIEPPAPPESVESLDLITVSWRGVRGPSDGFILEPDEGAYYVDCKWDRRDGHLLNCYVTGINGAVTFAVDPEGRALKSVRVRTPIPLSDLVSASSKSVASIRRPLKILDSAEVDGGHKSVLDVLLGLDPVVAMLDKRFSQVAQPADENLPEPTSVPTEAVWRSLLETESASLLRLEVTGSVEEDRDGLLRVPYLSEDNRPMDFASDDRVFVSIDDDTYLATLNIIETTPDQLVLDPNRSWARKLIKPGGVLRLESVQSKASRDRRARAIERVLDRASVLPDLAGYFDTQNPASTGPMTTRPLEARIRELYDSPEHQLNDRQVDAFQHLVERGPVGVLQGPPGTGKTTFVGAFIHYLFSELHVRNVLLVGQSHTAVDAVAQKARAMCELHSLPLSVVRMGQERMVATEMLDAHSRAIQRQMRHSFHREFEHRIEIFSERLGLPARFVTEIAVLHRTLDSIFASAHRYQDELSRSRSESEGTGSASRTAEIQAQLDEVRSLAERIVRKRFPDHADGLLSAESPWDAILDHTLEIHGVNNPAAVSRLRALLSLSQEWLSVLHTGQANYDQFLVQTRQLVCGTLVGMGQKQLGVAESEFDWVIVDEAARAQASELMIPLQSGHRVLLVGDHKQLPPVYEPEHVRAASKKLHISEEVIRQTDFERAFRATQGVTLTTQYRMVEPICELVSSCFYEDDGVDLRTGRCPSPAWCSKLPSPLDVPVSWVDSGAGPNSTGEEDRGQGRYVNVHEARLVMRLLRYLASGETIHHLRIVAKGIGQSIGVITMYRAQKELLEKELRKAEWAAPLRGLIRVDTVDSYQGQESSFIILSLVRDNAAERQGFMLDPSRINVSLSRAQERLVIVGASQMWRRRNKRDPLGRVLRFIEERVSANDNRYVTTGDLELTEQQPVLQEVSESD